MHRVLQKKEQSLWLLIVSVVAMTIAIYYRDFTGVEINKFYYLILAVGFALILDYKSLIYYIFFLIPLRSGLPETYILPFLVLLIAIKNTILLNKRLMICFIILVFMEICHYPFYDFDIRWNKLIGFLSYSFIILYLISNDEGCFDSKKCLISYCVGLVVFLFGVYYISFYVGGIDFIQGQIFRIGATKEAAGIDENNLMLSENPNAIGWMSLSGMATVLVLYRLRQIKVFFLIIILGVCALVGALTISRTWMFCVVILTVLYALMATNLKERKSFMMLFLVIAISAVGVFLFLRSGFIRDMFELRMTNDTMKSGGSRVELYQEYNDFLITHPLSFLFGTGSVHYFDVVSDSTIDGVRITNSTHNGIQQILVSYGIIGLIFWTIMLIKAIKRNYKKGRLICWLPFIISFIFVQSCQLINPPYLMFIIVSAFISLRLSREVA